MPRWVAPLILVCGILFASLGLTRLSFDTDILSMMPGDLPEVKGLKAVHNAFSRNDELILAIRGGEDDVGSLGEASASLGKLLEDRGLAKHTRWRPRWEEDPAGIGELLAYLWMNADPALVRNQSERLAVGKSEPALKAALDRVATSMEGPDMVLRAHDPFGFLDHPGLKMLFDSNAPGGEAFESEDGRMHLLFADAPKAIHGYRDADAWLKQVRVAIADWKKTDGQGLTVHLTGEPAFSADIGVAMENDLSGSIGITFGLIGILFWWMQRRFSLLLGLTGILIIVFAVALGIAGWLYGELSIMALSSAEILIGLAVDYGLVICQEAKVAGHDRKELMAASGKPVAFGALTTTVVFLALNLGGLPGMAQLGSIVAFGLSAAAILMLALYLPFVAKFGVNRQPARGSGRVLPRNRMSWIITGVGSLASVLVLIFHGMPKAEFSSKIMQPRHSEAMETFESLQQAFPAFAGKTLTVVVEADSDDVMVTRANEAQARLEQAKAKSLIDTANLPIGWWPDAKRQTANRDVLMALGNERERLLAEADRVGFTQEGTALGRSVLEHLADMPASPAFPSSPAAAEILRLFVSRDAKGGGHLLGTVVPGPGIDPSGAGYDALSSLSGDGIWLSGWELFKPAIARLVRNDMTRMLVPMFVLLVGMMFAIFRRTGDVALALFAMVVSTLWLLAIMSLTGLSWNFVNLMATPLLLGTGIDYAIHVTLSLRRTHGDFKELWQGTGKALLFCGASNVIGFGSLVFSSSDAMVSLGNVAVIGILLSMGTSIFLLPGWRRSVEHRAKRAEQE